MRPACTTHQSDGLVGLGGRCAPHIIFRPCKFRQLPASAAVMAPFSLDMQVGGWGRSSAVTHQQAKNGPARSSTRHAADPFAPLPSLPPVASGSLLFPPSYRDSGSESLLPAHVSFLNPSRPSSTPSYFLLSPCGGFPPTLARSFG